MALAFAMLPRLYFLRDTRLDLFFQPVSIQAHQEAFQLALFLLAKALQAVEQPLRAGSRISARMLQALLHLLQHNVGITRSSQRIGGFSNAAVYAPERFRPAAGLKSIQRSAQAARRDTHPMHRFNIFMFEHFIWKLQKFLQALAQCTPPGLLERLYLSLYPIWTDERGAGGHESGQRVLPVVLTRCGAGGHVVQPAFAITFARQQDALANTMRADIDFVQT